MSNELEKKSEELEQTFMKQVQLFKEGSKGYLKVGGVALAVGLVAYAFMLKKKKSRNRETDQALILLEREGLLTKELKNKLTATNKGTFWPSLRERLLMVGLAYAKEKFLPNLFTSREDAKSPEESK
jgi:hypothetical protein